MLNSTLGSNTIFSVLLIVFLFTFVCSVLFLDIHISISDFHWLQFFPIVISRAKFFCTGKATMLDKIFGKK